MARTAECYVFTADIDHIEKANNVYRHRDGIFQKTVRPLSQANGDLPLDTRHGEELFAAVDDAYRNKLKSRLVLLKGTKNGTSKGGVKGAVDPDWWEVTALSGDLSAGFRFVLERASSMTAV